MAPIPRSVLDYVTRQVNALSADAQAKVVRALESIEWTPDNIAQCREIVVQALQAVLPAYTDAAAQAGADMYDAVRTVQVGEAMGATAASGYRPDAVEGAVKAMVQQVVDGKPVEAFNRSVLDRVDYEMKRACNVSVAENAARDPLRPRYARVPSGAETCSFCLMLASRGFVYTSREAASHAHAGCDCRVVPGFPGMEVEGYDPDELYRRWSDPDGRDESRGSQTVAEGESEGWRDERERRTVDMARIGGKGYRANVRRLFGGMHETAHADISRMLRHRSGTAYEDLYAYDLTAGARIGSVVNADSPKRAKPSAELRRGIADAVSSGHEVVMLHNHPDSMSPSAADINSLITTGARRGVIACHDGSIYVYEVVSEPAPGYTISDSSIARMLGFRASDSEESVLKAFEECLGVRVEHLA